MQVDFDDGCILKDKCKITVNFFKKKKEIKHGENCG
ncbi:hypothetical protein HDEF_1095 [Candidatus Hamiltonella defensa 5AT (Acyrthosiphon pisum)]|uniref:Uncharacterized protein n=1 Tax=Hamiltonella defensa subsp. Acyrthosiphon pisum (strain 5AT) TaxID=572265 RepID=C4K5C6_HAMD5|nr:hypothetical protein HDEF_1095 [Candidatus Hamiltonella defensa 5AT (Acyrthosiphon pisum)]